MTEHDKEILRHAIDELEEKRSIYFKKGNPHAIILGERTNEAIALLEKLCAA